MQRGLFQKAHIFKIIAGGAEFTDATHFALELLIKIGVLFILNFFRSTDGGTHGQILNGERVFGEDFDQIVILPKGKSAFDIGFGAFQNLRHRADRKIDVLFLAKEQAVEIDFYGEPVGFGQIFSYELIFDGNVRIAVEVFRKRTKGHKGSSSRERAPV